MTRPEIPDSASTLAALLEDAKRTGNAAIIATAIVQYQGDDGTRHPGPLATLVRRHDETALDLYLLFRALATAAPYDVARDARLWARALGHIDDKGVHNTHQPARTATTTSRCHSGTGQPAISRCTER
jgi:hypothetical protein